jgi:hypothetical protein
MDVSAELDRLEVTNKKFLAAPNATGKLGKAHGQKGTSTIQGRCGKLGALKT